MSAHCGTTGIIYLMLCTCKAFYDGKTIREFRQRVGDHVYYSTNGKRTTVGCHIGLDHKYDPKAVRFLALEVLPPDVRGGDRDKMLLQREALWIERLNATVPPGLNKVNSLSPFF